MSTMIFREETREAIRRGVGQLTRTVRSTLGPCGHTVMLANSFGPPTITKDGVTVANAIDLQDANENIGAKMAREVASKTNDIVLRACRSPLTWIAKNAGGNGRLICEKVAAAKGNCGYNAAEDRFEDLVVAGVIDPAKVVRCGLQRTRPVSPPCC